jgi:ech hydrogenase subunit D
MKYEEQPITVITIDELLARTTRFFHDGYRLVHIGCTRLDGIFEINYSFDKDYRFETLRVELLEGGNLPSISSVYFGAFIYENEIHDLFGISVTGMNIDFKGTLYRTTVKYPFSTNTNKEDDSCPGR